ncbi:threonine dehydrogenase and related Zn-dependent dehydrogenase [Amycolatopsis mediterranei S699]|uniref:Threonine dehydrogenase and related Zn-dependent dehydrogenase n=2 Tax=Amycolatopsis mediterranei TaxID=33910 RepID=A0A0H3DFQ9_AMYMU|nr:zinc-binding dehydrogenase [Amycolatopsis mediterranei]ADJ48948.1 threonine dehydrogenase and related Zn-dependent dehydrogenase [Amycolatopsis mediterranei U32]AEK45896.1 threonine dehydrogenase and related Zn-dependent dehydrogenase [Amycolatopsis mediterranei S699]AFO80656.1 threonine dehydrogenase and related Zn-dependent dehydrogenase [Amycolatopsis mediterranei S699]AGT87784.1 threonine dehydrogenase-related Zn-dependent dehydrogenase [Amycolatopsis mediterranei RB]KDU93932.1 theronin
MKSVLVTGPGRVDVVEVPKPSPGPRDVLVRMRACGICGSDAYYVTIGGIPPRQGATPLGHEGAGEVVEVGAEVTGFAPGDHVVMNPLAPGSQLLGSGGPMGALSEYLVFRDAEPGRELRIIPRNLPFDLAAINEPMAVARHAVNRTAPQPGDTVAVFGAGPIGLGAVLGYRISGAKHVVVIDVQPARLEKALAIGADAVINSAEEDVAARLTELHGPGATVMGAPRAGTDIYLDAAGAPAVIDTALAAAKANATLGIVAVHKKPVPVDFGALLGVEPTIVTAMGYPQEIFQVTDDIVANQDRFGRIISHRFPFTDVLTALETAATPGAADKVVVTFD